MRNLLIVAATAALAAACSNADTAKNGESGAAPASPAAPQAPRAGLWEQTTSGGMIPAPTTMKICVGEPAPGTNPFETPPAAGTECTRSGTATDFSMTCTANGMTIVSSGKVTGDMNSAYKVEAETKTTGPNVPPQMADMKMTIEARRIGDCPAGVQPGAMVP